MSQGIKIKEAFGCEPFHKSGETAVEHMLVIENLNKVKVIQAKMAEELIPLKERQDLVSLHHRVLKEINAMIETNGSLDSQKFVKMINDIKADLELKMATQKADLELKGGNDPQIQPQLDRLAEKFKPALDFLDDTLKVGDEIKKGASSFTKEQKDRLVENIRMDMEDLNIKNDMQLQKVSRLNNETYESHQSARLMLKTVHDAFINLIKAWRS